MNKLIVSEIVLAGLAACKTMTQVTATEATPRKAWHESLPSRSRDDTERVGRASCAFLAQCANHVDLVPGVPPRCVKAGVEP